jgi:hypothetical protein
VYSATFFVLNKFIITFLLKKDITDSLGINFQTKPAIFHTGITVNQAEIQQFRLKNPSL